VIEYLAARTGHKCVRINNHEHTDVQVPPQTDKAPSVAQTRCQPLPIPRVSLLYDATES